MNYRIFIYDAKKRAQDPDFLEAVLSLGTFDKSQLLAVLRNSPSLCLNDLEKSAAENLFQTLQKLNVDCDLEPMGLPEEEKSFLKRESAKWLKRGFLLPYQVQALFNSYGMGAEAPAGLEPPRKEARSLIQTILLIGTLLVGLGIVLFIASNWKKIPDPAKITGVFTLTLAFLFSGYYYRHVKKDSAALGSSLLLLSAFGIGANVILLGQIYHVIADHYTLPLIWGLLVLPLGVLTGFLPAVYFSSLLWFLAHFLYQNTMGHSSVFFPVFLLFFLLPYAARLADKRLLKTSLVLLMAALVCTIQVKDFYGATLWVLALTGLRCKYREKVFDGLLMAGGVIWNITFLQNYENFPNVFYLLPLVYFTWRARTIRSNGMMIANILNFIFWQICFYHQMHLFFAFSGYGSLQNIYYFLTLGVLFYGAGQRLTGQKEWEGLRKFLSNSGLVLMVFTVFVLSFRAEGGRLMFYTSPVYLMTVLVFLVAGIALALPRLLADIKVDTRNLEVLSVLALVGLSVLLTLAVPPQNAVHSMVNNIILFFTAFIFMVRGQRFQRIFYYQCGIGIFVVLITARYFDSFMAYMPRSIFFILGGIFLITWAVFIDRQRKKFAGENGESHA